MKSPRVNDEELNNFRTFKDCLSIPLLEESAIDRSKGSWKSKTKAKSRRKTAIANEDENSDQDIENGAEELAEFVDVILTLSPPFMLSDLNALE
jgi:hypothetical protein